MKELFSLLLLFVVASGLCCFGQTGTEEKPAPVTIKTNLLYDATATINLGAEFRLGNKTSLEVPFNLNPFTFSNNRKWKHFLVQPELRLWTKETFDGHFFGLHSHYAIYNVGNLPNPFSQYMRDHRFEGWLVGAGISYGHRWRFNYRLGMEAFVGVGYAYLDYGKYPCYRCAEKIADETKNYFGPTKAGISLVYNIGGKKAIPAPVPEPVEIIEIIPEVLIPYTPMYAVTYVVPEVEAIKRRSESGKAYLDFVLDKSDILPNFKRNAAELQKIYNLIETVKNDPDATVTGFSIMGYASPEGSVPYNLNLSGRRALSLKNHLRMKYGIPESQFLVEGMGEDWPTLDSLVSQSFMNDQYAVLGIIRSLDDFDEKDRKLKALSGGRTYKTLEVEMFPQLRRTDYQMHFTVLPFTIEKGKEVFKVNPSKLSINEMFLIANTYDLGSERFNEILETAARIFPNDDVANLNAAASALDRGDATLAGNYLSKIQDKTAPYHNNMGVWHGLREEWEKAAEAFKKAVEAGNKEALKNATETTEAIESRTPVSNRQ